MSSYGFLAGCYDQFTTDVDYAAWGDYIQRHFQKNAFTGSIILDLACGTGSLTWELARRGYEMIGADRSPDMLAQAAAKDPEGCETAPIFLCQPMEQLDLYGTIDACVCCLDSVNYVTDPKKLQRAFERVHLFLMPGGLFLFDVNTPEKLQALDGQVFWTRRRTHTACGGRSTPPAAVSAPILWTSSGRRRGNSGGAGRSCTRNGLTPWRS